MLDSEKKMFLGLVTQTFAAYGKPLPEGALTSAWWDNLRQFPFVVVSAAVQSYRDEQGEFPPVPAGIAKRCKLMDGRPTADEAWAIAVRAKDESESVVWTDEASQAFGFVKALMSDAIAARRAFIDAYNRLVADARAEGRQTRWTASYGWDLRKREAVISAAQVAGYLPAPEKPLSIGCNLEKDDAAKSGIEMVRAALSILTPMSEKLQAKKEAELKKQREEAEEKKRQIAEQVAAYKGQA